MNSDSDKNVYGRYTVFTISGSKSCMFFIIIIKNLNR